MDTPIIGIDAGGTLIKVAYEEAGEIRYRKLGYGEAESLFGWLKLLAIDKKVLVTGGRATWMRQKFFPDADVVSEFEAVGAGASYLYSESKDAGPVGKFLLVNIGTGTSILLVDQENYVRVGGTGIGGGTLIGLGKLLAGTGDFSEIVGLASQGDRKKADMLVKDIYGEGGAPLNGEMTAANFGKNTEAEKEDLCASLINMVSETVILLSSHLASEYKVKNIFFVGSTVTGNAPLKDTLLSYAKMFGLQPNFLAQGEYCGALGALLAGK